MTDLNTGAHHGPPSRNAATGPGERPYDVVVVGSGFGGTFAAWPLVHAGLRVLMLERGDWVPRGERADPWTVPWRHRSEFSLSTPYLTDGVRPRKIGSFHCVGGRSVVYGGVALRLRERDFEGDPEVTGVARWPVGYGDMAPWYTAAERLLGVRGDVADDPTDPPRLTPLARTGTEMSAASAAIRDAALRLGLRPFRLPLAINEVENGRPACTACGACDGFACGSGAKNDLATVLLPALLRGGMELRTRAIALRLDLRHGRARALLCADERTGRRFEVRAERFVIAAGALATPHVLLASGAQRLSPAGSMIGANLMRHCNGIVVGATTRDGEGPDFRKQIGIHDFYFGEPGAPSRKLGAIQQLRATRVGLAQAPGPAALKESLLPAAERLTALIVMAEDQPVPENRVHLDRARTDRLGRPVARIRHWHTPRDRSARNALLERAEAILRETGAAFTFRVPIRTFSHALGTVGMGHDPSRWPLDAFGRLRGVENVRVSDGSAFPTSGAVNPSLTIAANALRIGSDMVREARGHDEGGGDAIRTVVRGPRDLPVVRPPIGIGGDHDAPAATPRRTDGRRPREATLLTTEESER